MRGGVIIAAEINLVSRVLYLSAPIFSQARCFPNFQSFSATGIVCQSSHGLDRFSVYSVGSLQWNEIAKVLCHCPLLGHLLDSRIQFIQYTFSAVSAAMVLLPHASYCNVYHSLQNTRIPCKRPL